MDRHAVKAKRNARKIREQTSARLSLFQRCFAHTRRIPRAYNEKLIKILNRECVRTERAHMCALQARTYV